MNMRLIGLAVASGAMLWAGPVDAQEACQPTILKRLITTSGVARERADELCKTATTLQSSSIVASLNFLALERLINAIGPLNFDIASSGLGSHLEVRDLQVCPTADPHAADVLAVGRLVKAGSPAPPVAQSTVTGSVTFEPEDCKRPVKQIISQLAGKSTPGASPLMIRLNVSWEPWNLRVRLLRIAGAVNLDSPSAQPIVVPLEALRLPLGSTSVEFMPILFFHGSEATVFLTENDDALRRRLVAKTDVPPLAAMVESPVGSRRLDETFVLSLRDSITSKLIDRWGRSGGLVVQSGDPSIGKITVSNPSIKSGDRVLSLGLNAQTEKGDSYAARVDFAGGELSVKELSVQATAKCADNDLACQLRAALAPVIAAAISAAYKGRLIHDLVKTEAIQVRFGPLVCDISPIITRMRTRSGELQILGNLMFAKPSQ